MKEKKLLVFLLALSLILSACGSKSDENVKKVGIIQFAQHGSLDNCREGIIEELEEMGYVEGDNLEIDYQNGQADTGITAQIASNFVANKYDLIIAIATPAAMSSFNATLDTDIPVVYTAISDPIEAKFANEDGSSTGNITGTSDQLPVEDQLKMIREILPDATKLGIMYTTSEANSISTIEIYKKLASDYGFDLITESVTSSSDIPLACDSILGKVDCLTNLTDNTVVNSLPTILDKANSKGIPVFGSEIEQVRVGCIAAEGIEYVELGRITGNMVGQILMGEKSAKDMKYESIEESSLYINKKAAENLGITIPQSMEDRAVESFDSIEK